MNTTSVTVEEYTPEFRDAVRKIHISTASEHARTDAKHRDYSLWMYCDEYINHEVSYLLFDENHIPKGYILCAEDFYQWKENMKPYAEKIKALGNPYDIIVERTLSGYEHLADRYPAHLHIDILEDFTGSGHGTMLMKALFERLEKDHVKGLCLYADKKNKRACGFYKHCGFDIFHEDEHSIGFGKQFV